MEEKRWHKFYDEGVLPSLDYKNLTLPQILDESAAKYPNQTALLFEGFSMTYAQLKDSVDRFATALAALGVVKGDRVAIQLPNLPQCVIAYYGVLRAGAIAVMTNPMYVEREVVHQFNDSGAKVAIILDALWMKTARKVRDKLPCEHYILTGIKDYLPFPKNLLFPLVAKKTGMVVKVPPEPGVLWLKDLLASHGPTPPTIEWDMEDLCNLQYTGGTTGVSKGAMLTHRNLSCNVQQCRAWFPVVVDGEETMLSALPFFHSFGLTVCMNLAIYVGGAQVCVPNPRDIPKLVGIIAKSKASLFPAVPTLFTAINEYPGIEKNIDISSLKGCLSGSAPLPMEVMEKFEGLTGANITEGYGLTETSPVITANPLVNKAHRKAGSIGIPFPDSEAKIVDLETGTKEMPVGERGEVILHGPQVMKGYWNRDDETAETLRDGWLYTGDIGTMDEDGFFYIVGRKKEMIIAGGYNIYPREIDEVLYEHPKVLEAAAVGIPHPHRGETVKAYITLKEGETATEEEIIEYCKSKLAAYKVPKLVEFRDELPKSTVGKVLRRVLKEEEAAKAE
ncbi:MAG: long-chain fatty acid--CoA ligase [Deltaproteobacteria bacterium]|nr:long-chain fatty acid--CoA ligase [Deltaproteobacteria bacterium]